MKLIVERPKYNDAKAEFFLVDAKDCQHAVFIVAQVTYERDVLIEDRLWYTFSEYLNDCYSMDWRKLIAHEFEEVIPKEIKKASLCIKK